MEKYTWREKQEGFDPLHQECGGRPPSAEVELLMLMLMFVLSPNVNQAVH